MAPSVEAPAPAPAPTMTLQEAGSHFRAFTTMMRSAMKLGEAIEVALSADSRTANAQRALDQINHSLGERQSLSAAIDKEITEKRGQSQVLSEEIGRLTYEANQFRNELVAIKASVERERTDAERATRGIIEGLQAETRAAQADLLKAQNALADWHRSIRESAAIPGV